MNSGQRKVLPSILLWVAAALAAAAAFAPGFPPFPFLSLLPAVAVAMAFAAGTGPAVLAAIVASVILVAAQPRLAGESGTAMMIPALIVAAWAGVFVIDWHTRREEARRKTDKIAREAVDEEARTVRKEISFYEARASGLSQRSELRRRMSGAALELGAVLDPTHIQEKSISLARTLFSGSDVALLTPDVAGAASPVFQRGQAILVADQGRSTMAAPVRAGNAVIAALSVSATARDRVFATEDLRLLDVVAGLASEALDNAALFDSVHQNALRDGLTGLLTHRAFQDRLESAILEASRYQKPLSLIMADIDHFKSVNDTHGHQAGDAVLQGFAHVMDRNVRDVDLIARYGGEEFVLLLYEIPYAGAMEVAERIRHDLAEQPFEIGGGRTLSVTASFGVASFPEDATSGQQVLRQADQRLYAAKKSGRNKVGGRGK